MLNLQINDDHINKMVDEKVKEILKTYTRYSRYERFG